MTLQIIKLPIFVLYTTHHGVMATGGFPLCMKKANKSNRLSDCGACIMIILCDGSVQLLQDECDVRAASNYELHNLQNDYKMRSKGNDMHDY